MEFPLYVVDDSDSDETSEVRHMAQDGYIRTKSLRRVNHLGI